MSLDHELISPAAIRDWRGVPPMWFAVGELEKGRYGNAVLVSRAASCGVRVTWTDWQRMCHKYRIVTRVLPQAYKTFELWAMACIEFDSQAKAEHIISKATLYTMPDCKETEMSRGLGYLMPLPFECIRQLTRISNAQRPVWTGDTSRKFSRATRL